MWVETFSLVPKEKVSPHTPLSKEMRMIEARFSPPRINEVFLTFACELE
jgi:hypothetical protein